MNTNVLGYHIVADLFGCDSAKINDREFVRTAMLEAAKAANATIVTDVFHSFNPYGLSGVVVIAESHLAMHSWPEHGCVAIDIFSCSDKMNAEKAVNYLTTVFEAERVVVGKTPRGVMNEPAKMREVPA